MNRSLCLSVNFIVLLYQRQVVFSLTPSTDFDRFFNVFVLGLFLGSLFVIIGLGYLFDPKGVVHFNALMRDIFFKDAHVLLNGKRIGGLLLVCGFLLFVLSYKTQLP